MTMYTVLAYRPNRNERSGSSESDFDFITVESITEATQYYANALLKNSKIAYEYYPHELTLLIDGLDENSYYGERPDGILYSSFLDTAITIFECLVEEEEIKAAEKERQEKLAREKLENYIAERNNSAEYNLYLELKSKYE